MQSLRKPPSGGFFYFCQRNNVHSHAKRKNQAKKKHPCIQVLFNSSLRGLSLINELPRYCITALLQIHVQLHTAQGAAVACSAATVAHATQRGGLKLVLRYLQAKKQIGVLVAFFTA